MMRFLRQHILCSFEAFSDKRLGEIKHTVESTVREIRETM